MEYRLHWVSEGRVCVGHVHFMLFVSLLVELGSQRERNFQWNTGLCCHTNSYPLTLLFKDNYLHRYCKRTIISKFDFF